MPSRRVARAEDASGAARARAATLVDARWPRRGDGRGFTGARAARERDGATRCARFVLEVASDDDDDEGDEGWRCAGACVVEDSCAVRGREGARNGMMRSVVVDDAMRRRGHGAALVRRATALALAEWDVVTVWCEKGLVKFYESCGYVYEPAKGRRYAEDDEAVLRATRDSVRDARGISTGG